MKCKPWIRHFQPRKFQCFSSQFGLHGLRALDFNFFRIRSVMQPVRTVSRPRAPFIRIRKLGLKTQERKKHINIKNTPKIPQLGSHPKNSLCRGSFPGKSRRRDPPHIKNLGSQIFIPGTPLILYVFFLYVLFSRPKDPFVSNWNKLGRFSVEGLISSLKILCAS